MLVNGKNSLTKTTNNDMFVINKIKRNNGVDIMAEIKDIKEISAKLSTENKKYVIAVANALLFSQAQTIKPKASNRLGKKRAGVC